MERSEPEGASAPPALFAWAVHAFTATGAVLGLFALMAVLDRDWTEALLWLLAALVVDGVDGSFARWAQTKQQAPRIDGDALDLIIDYLNYVFVPAVMIWLAGLVPQPLAPYLAGLILISSLYCFTRRDMKSEDNYFRGFPALWNVIAFYLLVARPNPETGAVIVVVFAVMTFAPVHFVHPFRVRDYGSWPAILALVWTVATVAMLWPGWSDGIRGALLLLSAASAIILVALGLLRTVRGKRPAARTT